MTPTEALPVPGFERYRVTRDGTVFGPKGRQLKTFFAHPNALSPSVNLYTADGELRRASVAVLLKEVYRDA